MSRRRGWTRWRLQWSKTSSARCTSTRCAAAPAKFRLSLPSSLWLACQQCLWCCSVLVAASNTAASKLSGLRSHAATAAHVSCADAAAVYCRVGRCQCAAASRPTSWLRTSTPPSAAPWTGERPFWPGCCKHFCGIICSGSIQLHICLKHLMSCRRV